MSAYCELSFDLCERIIERDANITEIVNLNLSGLSHRWWRVTIDTPSRRFEGVTRFQAVRRAAEDLQRRLSIDLPA